MPIRCRAILIAHCLFAPVAMASVPECTDAQLSVPPMTAEAAAQHRPFPLPAVSYPFGTKRDTWNFALTLRIDPTGRVGCFRQFVDDFSSAGLNDERRKIIEQLDDWRYTPFMADGRPAAVTLRERIPEQELPQKHRTMPDATLANVHISLDRSECYGFCPNYRVDLYGGGLALYEGRSHVTVRGKHRYRIAPESVRKLIDCARAKDLWSMRSKYVAAVTDNPTFELTIDLGGGKSQTIVDYLGDWVGMPAVISEFEEEIDAAARTERWTSLTQDAVAALEAEKFPFATAAGAELLERALRQYKPGEDAALARLVALGVPLAAVKPPLDDLRGREPDEPVLQSALRIGHPLLAAALIEKGALETNGRLDQAKLDGAFRAAVEGANLPLMKLIWAHGGDALRPSLQYEDVVGDDPPARKVVPVILLLGGRFEEREWDLTPVAEWLIAHGCDVYATRANGANLLHNAAGSDDVKFTRFLLLRKLDPSNTDSDGIVPLGATHSEEVALALLAAGTDLNAVNRDGSSFRDYAQYNSWYRVLAWLDAHGN